MLRVQRPSDADLKFPNDGLALTVSSKCHIEQDLMVENGRRFPLRLLPMTVHCEGDCRVIEQVGEKQDFESELSQLGFRHEDFILYIGVVSSKVPRQVHYDYSVTVANIGTGQQRVYHGGPGQDWVKECARDLATGVFGKAV